MSSIFGRLGTLLLLVLATACTVSDDAVFDDIGVTRLILVDPGLVGQSLVEAEDRIQVAQWVVQSATLDLGDRVVDLLAGESCEFVDTPLGRVSLASGACGSGVVLETNPDDMPQTVTLTLAFTMELRRAEPLLVVPGDDSDGDGVPNDGNGSGSSFDAPCTGGAIVNCDDNCPLVANPDQADLAMDGIGNACVLKDVFGALADNDDDGIADAVDNCVGIPNSDQANTEGIPSALGDPGDWIGNACTEEVAQVHLKGDLVIRLEPEILKLIQPRDAVTFLTVDLNDQRAISCNWDFGVCTLDPAQVRVCVSNFTPILGCPAG